MNILAIVPARGGSKGIPQKNIYPLYNTPLIYYTIKAIQRSKLITRAILSSDSSEVIKVAEDYGLEVPFVRPSKLAQDDTPALPVVEHAVKWLEETENYKVDYIILLQPTSPLRTENHIDEALSILINSDADSIVSIVEVPHNFNPYSIMKLQGKYLSPYLLFDEKKNLRQFKPVFYARNGAAIYAFTYNCLMNKHSLYGDKILPYLMEKESSIDVDDLFDLKLCEWILSSRE
jgi:CMP-N,N'-diacetyllegionaminic acid synthase